LSASGLAGLTCAYQLRKAGCLRRGRHHRPSRAMLVDQRLLRRRPGRRARRRVDRSGTHRATPTCAVARLGSRYNLLAGEQNGTEPGIGSTMVHTPIPRPHLTSKAFGEDQERRPPPATLATCPPNVAPTGSMSIIDWINECSGRHDLEARTTARRCLQHQYGAECSVQSLPNLPYLLGSRDKVNCASSVLRMRNTTCGGNDQDRRRTPLAAHRSDAPGSALTALHAALTARTTSRAYQGQERHLQADKVVWPPFAVLRTLDISRPASRRQTARICELGMGTNSETECSVH
jgi:hypothetical protein